MSLITQTYVVYAILKITVLHSSVIFFVNYFKINVYKTCLCKISVYICSIQNKTKQILKNYENNRIKHWKSNLNFKRSIN